MTFHPVFPIVGGKDLGQSSPHDFLYRRPLILGPNSDYLISGYIKKKQGDGGQGGGDAWSQVMYHGDQSSQHPMKLGKKLESTAPGIPRRSPIQVLTRRDIA